MASVRGAVGQWARQHAECRIDELGAAAAWQRWPDDPYIAELRKLVDDRPGTLGFAVHGLLSMHAADHDAPRLACAYLCAALLLSLAEQPRGRPSAGPECSRWAPGSNAVTPSIGEPA